VEVPAVGSGGRRSTVNVGGSDGQWCKVVVIEKREEFFFAAIKATKVIAAMKTAKKKIAEAESPALIPS